MAWQLSRKHVSALYARFARYAHLWQLDLPERLSGTIMKKHGVNAIQ
jgi:hypothetical protein